MEKKETLRCPNCDADTGESLEDFEKQGLSFVVCDKCGTRIPISTLDLSRYIRGFPKT